LADGRSFVFDLKTSEALDVRIPPVILARADVVIE
jgi:hypothetical protein